MQILLASWNCENQTPYLTGRPGYDFDTLFSLSAERLWKEKDEADDKFNPDVIVISMQEASMDSINNILMHGGNNPIKANYTLVSKQLGRGMTKWTRNCLRLIIYVKTTLAKETQLIKTFDTTNMSKGCLASVVKIGEDEITAIGCHLDSNKGATRVKELETMRDAIVSWAKTRSSHWQAFKSHFFILGDYNTRLSNVTDDTLKKVVCPGEFEEGPVKETEVAKHDQQLKELFISQWCSPLPRWFSGGDAKELRLDTVLLEHALDREGTEHIVLPPTYPRRYKFKSDVVNNWRFAVRPTWETFNNAYGKGDTPVSKLPYNKKRKACDVGWLDRISYAGSAEMCKAFFANYNVLLSDHAPVLMVYDNKKEGETFEWFGTNTAVASSTKESGGQVELGPIDAQKKNPLTDVNASTF